MRVVDAPTPRATADRPVRLDEIAAVYKAFEAFLLIDALAGVESEAKCLPLLGNDRAFARRSAGRCSIPGCLLLNGLADLLALRS